MLRLGRVVAAAETWSKAYRASGEVRRSRCTAFRLPPAVCCCPEAFSLPWRIRGELPSHGCQRVGAVRGEAPAGPQSDLALVGEGDGHGGVPLLISPVSMTPAWHTPSAMASHCGTHPRRTTATDLPGPSDRRPEIIPRTAPTRPDSSRTRVATRTPPGAAALREAALGTGAHPEQATGQGNLRLTLRRAAKVRRVVDLPVRDSVDVVAPSRHRWR